MKKLIISALCSIGLTIGLVGSANAGTLTGVPSGGFVQDYTDGQMYYFVNIGGGQIAYYIGDNHALVTMVDNAGHAGDSLIVYTDSAYRITMVSNNY